MSSRNTNFKRMYLVSDLSSPYTPPPPPPPPTPSPGTATLGTATPGTDTPIPSMYTPPATQTPLPGITSLPSPELIPPLQTQSRLDTLDEPFRNIQQRPKDPRTAVFMEQDDEEDDEDDDDEEDDEEERAGHKVRF